MPEIAVLLHLGQAIIAALLASSYGIVHRHIANPVIGAITMGGLFGVVAILSMVSPIEVSEGGIVDLRNLFIGLSFASFGGSGGAVTLAMAIGARLMIGGDGTFSGVFAMCLAGAGGQVWRALVLPRLGRTILSHQLLGAMIAVSLAGALTAPDPLRSEILFGLGPTLFLFYLLGSLMLGGLLSRELTLIEQSAALVQAARTDPLTRLPNRRGLQVFLEELSQDRAQNWAQNRASPGYGLAMICIDVDRFKWINDTHGHRIGDEVLCEVTRRIGQHLRPGDLLARHGGDEFIALLTGLASGHAIEVAETIRHSVSEADVKVGTASIPVTVSVGLHWVPRFESFDALFARSDAALYAAKTEGRNRVRPAVAA